MKRDADRLEEWFAGNGWSALAGNADVLPRRGDQVFVIAEQEVLQVA